MSTIPDRSRRDPAIAARLADLAGHTALEAYADELADECRLLLGDNRALSVMCRTYRDAAAHAEQQRDWLRDALTRADARTVALVKRERAYQWFAALALCGAILGALRGW